MDDLDEVGDGFLFRGILILYPDDEYLVRNLGVEQARKQTQTLTKLFRERYMPGMRCGE